MVDVWLKVELSMTLKCHFTAHVVQLSASCLSASIISSRRLFFFTAEQSTVRRLMLAKNVVSIENRGWNCPLQWMTSYSITHFWFSTGLTFSFRTKSCTMWLRTRRVSKFFCTTNWCTTCLLRSFGLSPIGSKTCLSDAISSLNYQRWLWLGAEQWTRVTEAASRSIISEFLYSKIGDLIGSL